MKRFFVIVGAVAAVGLIALGIWLWAVFSKSPTGAFPSVSSSTTLPAAYSQTQNGASVPVQNIESPKDQDISQAFLGQLQNANQVAVGGTVVATPYAVQIWGSANEGGQALLEYSSSTEWTLISFGGGEWDVVGLMQEGVSLADAEQLIIGLNNGIPIASAPPSAVPAGDTITIGTPKGSVTTNNFYEKAVYIAPDQGSVVIEQDPAYDIVYNVSDDTFTISVFSTPFETVRQAAEAGFLSSLGISQQDACRLGAYEIISGIGAGQYAGKSFPLSFCASGAFGQ